MKGNQDGHQNVCRLSVYKFAFVDSLKPRLYAQYAPRCKYTPGCKFAHGVYFGHINGVL